MPRPIVLDMELHKGELRVWSGRDGKVHLANEDSREITITQDQWNELVVAVRVGDWERRS